MIHDRRGSVKGTETLNNNYQGRVPLLSYFELEYEKLGEPGGQIDNEFRGVVVQPEIGSSQLTVGLYDTNPTSTNDRVKYRAVHVDIDPQQCELHRSQRGDDLIAIEEVVVLPGANYNNASPQYLHPAALMGFRLQLIDSEDRELYRLGFLEEHNTTSAFWGTRAVMSWHVPFGLGLPDRRIDWDVQFAVLPQPLISAARIDVSGSAIGATTIPVPVLANPNIALVLSSFHFAFKNGHHHIRRIAVGHKPGTTELEVAFHDKNADDPFEYDIRYLLIQT